MVAHRVFDIIKNILPILNEPKTARQLAEIFNRSLARIQDILIDLKKKDIIKNFRVKSIDYWTNKSNLIIISKLKNQYLSFLDNPKQTSEFAKYFKVDWKSSFKRLRELQKLNLVRRQQDKSWTKLQSEKTIQVI